MTVTTIKVPSELRDGLSRVAADDFGGATLAETISRLLEAHIRQQILRDYAELQADPQAWTEYVAEVEEWAEVGADTLRRSGE